MPFYYADSVEIPAPVGNESGDALVAPDTDTSRAPDTNELGSRTIVHIRSTLCVY